jgi:putative ATPase
VISAFIKSMRGSDPDAAVYWLLRMLVAGEDPLFLARRLVILASEDVGLADPSALGVAVDAFTGARSSSGFPRRRTPCITPPSTWRPHRSRTRWRGRSGPPGAAVEDTRGHGAAAPAVDRLPGAEQLGHGVGYRYPHDHPDGIVPSSTCPTRLGPDLYRPGTTGAEAEVAESLRRSTSWDGRAETVDRRIRDASARHGALGESEPSRECRRDWVWHDVIRLGPGAG